MIDTERSPETTTRLHDEIMRERAEGLHEAAQTAKIRLVAREEALARLRTQVAMLKASLNPDLPVPAAAVLAPREEIPSAVTIAPLPRTTNWMSFAPYAAIAACAVLIELGGARLPTPVAPDLTALVHPAPAVVANARPTAKGAPVVTDEDRSQEALLLVHQWKLPGDTKSLGERLGGELEIPGGRPSWSVERTGAHGYRVTFQPRQKDLPYAFEADIESRVVWPTPDTQELLAPRFTAAFRDYVR